MVSGHGPVALWFMRYRVPLESELMQCLNCVRPGDVVIQCHNVTPGSVWIQCVTLVSVWIQCAILGVYVTTTFTLVVWIQCYTGVCRNIMLQN